MNEEKLDSFFGEGTSLKGTLKFKGLLRFDGDFEGSIDAGDTLIIGESGKLKAGIKSGKVFNFGKVEGDIKAAYKIQMYSKSSLKGNIEAPVVVMEETSYFEGACKMPPAPKTIPKGDEPVIHKEPPAAKQVDISKPTAAPAKKGSGWF